MFRAGQVLIGPYPPGSGKARRFFILTDEVPGEGTVILVFTSTSLTDSTVVLNPGDHPAITKQCCVVYEQAIIASTAAIRLALETGAIRMGAPLNADLLSRIQEGLFESDESPLRVIRYGTDRL